MILPDILQSAPEKSITLGKSIVNPAVFDILPGPSLTKPAVTVGVNKSSPPMFNLDDR